MSTLAPMGMNKTGTQMSPQDTQRQMEGLDMFPPDIEGDADDIAIARKVAIDQAEPIGSVPVPGSAKGMIKSSVQKMMGKNPEVLIDKLAERLAFERTGVRLYDALIAKVEALGHVAGLTDLASLLRQFREEEHGHFLLVQNAMEILGADPTAQTPCADLAGVSAEGIVKIITDPRTNLTQSLNAILIAELADNAGWELLIELCNAAGQKSMADDFAAALDDESQHLAAIKEVLKQELMADLS